MTTEQFTYWLQGFFEISEDKTLSEKQVLIIKDHLALVFDKVTPDRSKDTTNKEKSILTDGLTQKKYDNKAFHAEVKNPWEDNNQPPICSDGFIKKGPTIYC